MAEVHQVDQVFKEGESSSSSSSRVASPPAAMRHLAGIPAALFEQLRKLCEDSVETSTPLDAEAVAALGVDFDAAFSLRSQMSTRLVKRTSGKVRQEMPAFAARWLEAGNKNGLGRKGGAPQQQQQQQQQQPQDATAEDEAASVEAEQEAEAAAAASLVMELAREAKYPPYLFARLLVEAVLKCSKTKVSELCKNPQALLAMKKKSSNTATMTATTTATTTTTTATTAMICQDSTSTRTAAASLPATSSTNATNTTTTMMIQGNSNSSSNSNNSSSHHFRLYAALVAAKARDPDYSPASDQARRVVGVEYEFLKKFDQSLQAYRKGVEVAERFLGPDHAIAVTLRNSTVAARRTIQARDPHVRLQKLSGGR
jgi:hypothetical protein